MGHYVVKDIFQPVLDLNGNLLSIRNVIEVEGATKSISDKYEWKSWDNAMDSIISSASVRIRPPNTMTVIMNNRVEGVDKEADL